MATATTGNEKPPFMVRLAKDARGNTLAIMAASLIPICALGGSGIDTARMYLVKVRLQQACDAGVLAGRKFMVSSGDPTLDTTAQDRAQSFFANNFRNGWLSTRDANFTPAKTAGQQVAATARVTVPMTIMKMFGASDATISVQCEAQYDVADADIMFVLDTTGSMACAASDDESGCSTYVGNNTQSYPRPDGTVGYYVIEKSEARIKALRSAVVAFYDTIASSKDPSTHIRYGFVPYTSTINAGAAIPSSYIVNTKWTYNSRRVIGDSNYGSPVSSSQTTTTRSNCPVGQARTPSVGWNGSGQAQVDRTTWTQNGTSSNGKCLVEKGQKLVPVWRFEPVEEDLSAYAASRSGGGGAAVQDPSKVTASLNRWQGCVEERETTASMSFDIDHLPPDLDPDLIPSNDATKWKPMWPELVYNRYATPYDISDNYFPPWSPGNGYPNYYSYFYNVGGDANYLKKGFVSCGKPVQRLAELDRSAVQNYVNDYDFKAIGGTYHDTGMIWGTRMVSPNGIFKSDTSTWAGRNPPNRHIVFMTDGDMSPSTAIYGMYGFEAFDKRVSGGDFSSLKDRHNARFLAECRYARDRLNVTVWVVAFGQSMTPQLSGCATSPSSDHAFFASNDEQLSDAFRKIAQQVAMLRVSR